MSSFINIFINHLQCSKSFDLECSNKTDKKKKTEKKTYKN